MAHIHLIASPDDFLLEEHLRDLLRRVGDDLGGVEPEVLADDVTAEQVAVELCSPSLFSPQRLLVVPEARAWLESPPKKKGKRRGTANEDAVDTSAVTQVFDEGVSEDIALVVAAHCRSKPKGPFVAAVEACGRFHWHPVPPPPKPWEDVSVSDEQAQVLRGFVERVAGDVTFDRSAERLLFERLGFAPRLLVQEVRKLAAAADGGSVDEALVRQLSFPKDRSLEAAREAILGRRAAPVLDILTAAEGGAPVRDYQGQLVDPKGIPMILCAQATTIFQQLLYLRLLAVENGLEAELNPAQTCNQYWYPKRFKNGIGPRLTELIEADAPSPMMPSGRRKPAPFALGLLFRSASLYGNEELERVVADLGGLETALRGSARGESLSIFFSAILNSAS